MSDLRIAAQQALEALYEETAWFGPTPKGAAAIAALKAALAQQAEGGGNLPPPLQVESTGKQPLQDEPVATVAENATTQQRVVETPPSDYRRGYWDGFKIGKREGRIEAEDALAQQDESVEPGAWIQPDHLQKARIAPFLCRVEPTQRFADFVPLYLSPPQRKPLTDEEIDNICRQAHGGADPQEWARNFARAVERAYGIKE